MKLRPASRTPISLLPTLTDLGQPLRDHPGCSNPEAAASLGFPLDLAVARWGRSSTTDLGAKRPASSSAVTTRNTEEPDLRQIRLTCRGSTPIQRIVSAMI